MVCTGRGLKALLLDDDQHALDFLRLLLEARYPELQIEVRTKPDPSGIHDLYFLDDNFDGVRLAGDLAARIRERRPASVVLAFSAGLTEDTLKELLQAGCHGVCDKEVPSDMPEMISALDRCIEELEEDLRRSQQGGFQLLNTFRDLFRAWNDRLASQE